MYRKAKKLKLKKNKEKIKKCLKYEVTVDFYLFNVPLYAVYYAVRTQKLYFC